MKVFISHSSTDKKFVRMLKDALVENSIEIWFDEDQLDLGDNLVSRLDYALDTSSHLVIILSPSSIKSDWVKFELKKALGNTRTGLMQKIIPIKYRNCEIPEELKDILYADLSKEVVLPTDDGRKIKFISDGFDAVFLKLVRAIQNNAKAFNEVEKEEIIKSIKSSQPIIKENSATIHRGNYELIGFNSAESKFKYQKIIFEQDDSISNIEELRPFLLPASLKPLINCKKGKRFEIRTDLPFSSYGHFAGFRIDDLKIAIDKKSRDEIFLNAGILYQVEIDLKENIIRFVNNFDFDPKDKILKAGENNYALAA
ncbi:toll/interleukin-1 receptor domain-containing protein [Nonlabens sp. Ci31]|uniref:toll/interleukin-1 receptor domain-containing protein n=1 Tax=Nonlabens sp. Ci31 TaxID=2608253 RepID=UPI001462B4F9|nr:toll/interleukin-1 receptor domain-containing protein [Nonlabens sp. Ci31]QJP34541.1 toll/interleukin-1 receptor domain-containing protein [Nonlabens sp. Ci31]